ncbi:MAG: GNAT family N-acetyltransferase [Treponema sp.]|nr:GNAT family N-acetyltransferase [Treponema sp.]
MEIKRIKTFLASDLKELFSSVDWASSANPQKLVRAFQCSSNVVSAWEGQKLVGLIRSMDDGCWSANIDCLLVHKEFQGRGLAKKLMEELLEDLKNIEYINVCPDDKEMENFYFDFGFKLVQGCYLQKINSL